MWLLPYHYGLMLENENSLNAPGLLEVSGPFLSTKLSRLVALPLVVDQLEKGNGVVQIEPSGLPLDVAFVSKETTTTPSYLGLKLFGRNNVVGIRVRRTNVERGLRMLSDHEAMVDLEGRGAKAVVLTPRQLGEWLSFYESVGRRSLVDIVGHKAYEFSGLDWMTESEYGEMMAGLDQVMVDNQDYVEEFEVDSVEAGHGADVLFKGGDQIKTVKVSHFRKGRLVDGIMEEVVLKDTVDCAGMVICKVGETKRELYERARKAQEQIQTNFEKPIEVAAVSLGQVSLWRKLGFAETLPKKEGELSIDEVVRFLYLGKSNLEPGPLAKPPVSLSLPSTGDALSYTGIDLVFTRRINGSNERRVATVYDLLVLDRHGNKIPLGNVAGIKIYPSGVSFEGMKTKTKPYALDFTLRAGVPGAHVLNLTPELLNLWKDNGSPFYSQDKDAAKLGLVIPGSQLVEYSSAPKLDKVGYIQIRTKKQIGGTATGIVFSNADMVRTHLIDVGLSFEDTPKGFSGIGRQPGTSDGLLRLFRTGVLPMKPGWWHEDYLVQTAKKMSGLGSLVEKGDPVARYVVGELYEIGVDKISDKITAEMLGVVARHGQNCSRDFRNGRQCVTVSVSPTHVHVDHVALGPNTRSDIKWYVSGPSFALLNAMHNKSPTWRGRYMDRTMLTEPKVGSAYQTLPVDIFPYYYSDRPIRISPDLALTPYFVNHSIPGAVFQLYEMSTLSAKTRLFCSGDWRVNGNKDAYVAAEQLSGKPDVIVMEATNVGSEKPGDSLTEEDVEKTLLGILRNYTNDVIVVVAAPNNLERISGICRAASMVGRGVALGYNHAEMALQLAAVKRLAPAGAEGFDHNLPHELGWGNLTIWEKQMTAPRVYHQALLSMAKDGDIGVLDHYRLSKENNKWVVVVSPYDVLQDQFDGLGVNHNLDLVWMASYPHESTQKLFIGANYRWLKSANVKFIADMKVFGQGGKVEHRVSSEGILHLLSFKKAHSISL